MISVSRVCRMFRHEFLPYLLNRVEFRSNFDWLPRFVATFGRALYVCPASVILLYESGSKREPVDLLPLIEFIVGLPHLSLDLELPATMGPQLSFDILFTRDLNRFLHACRTNQNLIGYVKDRVLSSISFHSREFLSHRYPSSRLDTRIQVQFKRSSKQLWMDGAHSFDELRHFLATTEWTASILSMYGWVLHRCAHAGVVKACAHQLSGGRWSGFSTAQQRSQIQR